MYIICIILYGGVKPHIYTLAEVSRQDRSNLSWPEAKEWPLQVMVIMLIDRQAHARSLSSYMSDHHWWSVTSDTSNSLRPECHQRVTVDENYRSPYVGQCKMRRNFGYQSHKSFVPQIWKGHFSTSAEIT